MSLRQQVKGYIEKHPNASNDDLKDEFPDDNWNSVRPYANEFRKVNIKGISSDISPKEKITKSNKNSQPPQMSTGEIVTSVDDPVGFVTGIITEELMKTRDVRWATLFVSVLRESKKLDYNTQKEIEWQNQAKQLSIEDLVEKVAIKGSISKSTLRRLEKAADTSQYDSFLDV